MASEPPAPSGRGKESVGLLFVHGIGEQQRWEHLRATVVEFAELLRMHAGEGASVAVVDRTLTWQGKAGEPRIAGPAPITVSLRSLKDCTGSESEPDIDFECHEVWWADLGIRNGLFDSVRFWIWGLGQWAAPIYLERDASRLTSARQAAGAGAPRSPEVAMPHSVAGELGAQIFARFNLAWAGLVAVLTVLSLSLFKRIAGSLGQVDTAPSLLVQYIGDVQVYEQRALPGKGLTSDPGHPKRVAIRRRMVSEMVAMGARGHDRWYILAHSLGTVLAFNGIGEIGHTLPNYLPEALWKALPKALREDPACPRRNDPENMMPARPAWLDADACINRPALFKRLAGFVTYGSPLDKFAGLWPRIVAFETYGENPDPDRAVFADCQWINIVANSDPVAGRIDRFDAETAPRAGGDLPRLHNIRRSGWQPIGLSHLTYWRVPERWNTARRTYYRQAVGWLTGWNRAEPAGQGAPQQPPAPPFGTPYRKGLGDHASLLGQALVLTAMLWFATTAIIAMVVIPLAPTEWALFDPVPASDAGVTDYAWFAVRLMPMVAAGASVILYLAGHLRWLNEMWLNRRLAIHDLEEGRTEGRDLPTFIRVATIQIGMALASLSGGIALMLLLWRDPVLAAAGLLARGAVLAAVMLGLILLAAFLQSAINWLFFRFKYGKDAVP